jgi:hypothetical protein
MKGGRLKYCKSDEILKYELLIKLDYDKFR